MPDIGSNALAPMIDKLSRQSPLGSGDVAALSNLPCRLTRSDPGTYLVREGAMVDSCIVLLSGFVHRSKLAGDGSRQIMSIHMRGDLVDLQNSLLDQADHDVQALAGVELAYIPHEAIQQIAAEHPAIGQALWRDTLIDASIFREWILNVGQRDARQRITHLLCEFALRQDAAGLANGSEYAFPLTQEQLGDATGLTSVHVNRTIQSMRRDGLIKTGSRLMTILDWPRMRQAGDFNGGYLHLSVRVPA